MIKKQDSQRAVILLSGGLDSTTCLYLAVRKGFQPYLLTVDYGQRHRREIESARWLAGNLQAELRELALDLPWKGSALLDSALAIPKGRSSTEMEAEIPVTYVPARNTIFLSLALSWAEVLEAQAVYIGANSLDYSGYPDCRPEYFQSMEEVFGKGTKAGVEGRTIQIVAPLLRKTKAEVIKLAHELGVPFEHTWSCYEGGSEPCGECDSCLLRHKGFREAGMMDPLMSPQWK